MTLLGHILSKGLVKFHAKIISDTLKWYYLEDLSFRNVSQIISTFWICHHWFFYNFVGWGRWYGVSIQAIFCHIIGGRLAEYKYYDMAPVMEKVLKMYASEHFIFTNGRDAIYWFGQGFQAIVSWRPEHLSWNSLPCHMDGTECNRQNSPPCSLIIFFVGYNHRDIYIIQTGPICLPLRFWARWFFSF